MEIRPIRNDNDYQEALSEIERLFDAVPGSPQADKLDVFTTLVEAFEEENYPVPAPHPIEAILHSLEALGLTRKDLESLLGSRSRVSEILNRKRSLSLAMIRRLEDALEIPAEILIQPYDLADETSISQVMHTDDALVRDRSVYAFFVNTIGYLSANEKPQIAGSAFVWEDCYMNVVYSSLEAITVDETVGTLSRYDATAEPRAGYSFLMSRAQLGMRDRCLSGFSSASLDEATSYEEVSL